MSESAGRGLLGRDLARLGHVGRALGARGEAEGVHPGVGEVGGFLGQALEGSREGMEKMLLLYQIALERISSM